MNLTRLLHPLYPRVSLPLLGRFLIEWSSPAWAAAPNSLGEAFREASHEVDAYLH